MTLYNKDAEIKKNYRDITFQTFGSLSITVKAHFRTRLLDILETLDQVFDKVYRVYYDSNIVKFNVPLSSYVKNGNYTFTVVKFKQVTIGSILDVTEYDENIEDVVLNEIDRVDGLGTNLNLSLAKYNLDPNVLLSNGCRCKIEHVVCQCSSYSKTKYGCVCKNINLKDQKCYHYYYLNFTSTDRYCNIWTSELNELCDSCRQKITYMIYAIFCNLSYRRSWDYLLDPSNKDKTVNILYGIEFEMFIQRFRNLILYYFAHWMTGNYIDIVPKRDIEDIIRTINEL